MYPCKHLVLFKTSPRRLLKTSSAKQFFVKMSSRRLDVFKMSSRGLPKGPQDVFKKASWNYVLKTPWRQLGHILEDKKMLHWRRLQDVFKTPSVRLYQDKCLLGYVMKIMLQILENKLVSVIKDAILIWWVTKKLHIQRRYFW